MSDRNDRTAREDAETFSHGGSVWSARGIAGSMSGVGVAALVFGVAALVLAIVGRFPLLVLLIALIGVVCGMRLFLPRLTAGDKVLIPIGVVASLAALVVLLINLVQ